LIQETTLLTVIVKSIGIPELSAKAVNLAANIAMDSSHNGKLALLHVDILDQLCPLLLSRVPATRMSAISLISLLSVTKEGKDRIAMSLDIADALATISESDADLECRRSAYKARILVAELPRGRAIVGDLIDPSVMVRKETSQEQEAGVTRANPRIGDHPVTYLLSPSEAAHVIRTGPAST
jgi:hypothetical protein